VEDFGTRRDDIQGLRALAVISVIAFHLGVPGLDAGFLGVDIFFAISGYLMAKIIYNDVLFERFCLANFFIRRARRILPATYVTLAVSFCGSWFILFPKNFEDFTDVLAASSLFLANAVLMNQSSGYFSETLENHPLLHMWSLSVEEQFYLIFPLLFLVILRVSLKLQLLTLIILIAASVLLADIYVGVSASATFFHLPSRFFEFLVGVIAFILRSKTTRLQLVYRNLLSWSGLIIILFSLVFFDSSIPMPSVVTLIPLIGCCLVLCFGDNSSNQILSNKYAVYLGDISFSLYLLHQPIYALARYQGFTDILPLLFCTIVLVPLAWMQKTFVEDRFRNSSITNKTFLFGCGFLILLSLIIAIISKDLKGIPSRFDGNLSLALTSGVGSPLRAKCHTDGVNYIRPSDACVYFTGSSNWALVGDSHGIPVAYALADRLRDHEQAVVHLTFSGCGFHRTEGSHCRAWLAQSFDYLISNKSIKNVVLSFRLIAQISGRHEMIYPELPSRQSQEHIRDLFELYSKFVAGLEKANKRVIWIMQPPEVGLPMRRLLQKISEENQSEQSVSLSWWLKRSQDIDTLVASAVSEKTILIWPEKLFCSEDEDKCFAIKNSESLYRDQDHVSLVGATKIVDSLLEANPDLLDNK